MSEAVLSKSTVLSVEDASTPLSFLTVAEVTNIGGPAESADQVEVSHLGSVAKEYIAGLADGGEVTLEMNRVASDAGQLQMRDDFRAGNARSYKIVYPAAVGETDTFTASITKFSAGAVVNNALKFTATLKISGAVVTT